MSTSKNKKLSLLLINLDARSHSAYKAMTSNEQRNSTNTNTTSLKEEYKRFNHLQRQMNNPFGLTEERFQWQKTSNQTYTGRVMDLNSIVHKRVRMKSCLDGGFEAFYNKSPKTKNENFRQSNVKLEENLRSIRVIQPKRDVSKNNKLISFISPS